jgi:transaldolase
MKQNPLLKLESFGQSVWLDTLSRHAITSGELKRLIDEDGLRGVTSNPSIFHKAITGSDEYDEDIHTFASQNKTANEIYQSLTVRDIQTAADLFRTLYDRLDGKDGFVSLEVSPRLANDTKGTIAEARELWAAVNRPNAFIKVPATREGLPAITQLINEGINVNITLLFGLPRYREVAEAYLAGLEMRKARGKPLKYVASVASFFLSRIDVLVDPMLEKIQGKKAELAAKLHGQIAIASAKTAAKIYEEIFSSERFKKLAAADARTQRLLWASTSTKNPNYPDLKYVEPLIGRDTINTMPLETLEAYRDHGRPEVRLFDGLAEAQATLNRIAEVGIDLDAVTQQLENEGIQKFDSSYDKLISVLDKSRPIALAK